MGLLKKAPSAPQVDRSILDELQKIDLFADLDVVHLTRVAPLVEMRTVKAGAQIVRQGTVAHEFYVIVSGSAEASVRGKKRVTYGPGEFFGEMAIIRRMQSATVVAEDEMRVGTIDAKAFAELMSDEPSIAIHMVENLIARLDDMVSRPAGQLL